MENEGGKREKEKRITRMEAYFGTARNGDDAMRHRIEDRRENDVCRDWCREETRAAVQRVHMQSTVLGQYVRQAELLGDLDQSVVDAYSHSFLLQQFST